MTTIWKTLKTAIILLSQRRAWTLSFSKYYRQLFDVNVGRHGSTDTGRSQRCARLAVADGLVKDVGLFTNNQTFSLKVLSRKN
jgi:hypothetical protein